MTLSGVLPLSPIGVLLYTLALTHVTIVAVTVFLHRHQAHRALTLHPAVSHFLRFWLWLTTGTVTREWVAVHRKHHATCETGDDPHSPQVHGLCRLLWRGVELYRTEAARSDTVRRYGKGAPDDWLERHIYTPHASKGIVLMLIIDLLLLGPIGLTVWAVQMMWIPFFAAGVINGVGHYFGYRNFQSPDASTNIVPWGILIGGEELHNNHHAYPGSARLSFRWWEVDVGWLYIRALALVGLAEVRKTAPPPPRLASPGPLDLNVARAIVASRLQVLARYGQEVIGKVHRQELRRLDADRGTRGTFKQARRLLLREASLLDMEAKRRLEAALAYSQALQSACQFRDRLQAIWQRSGRPEEMLAQLQLWCREAEASGIDALRRFAENLRRYRLPA